METLFFLRQNTKLNQNYNPHQGSNFNDTTLDWRFFFAAFTNKVDRQQGAHHGLRNCCSPSRHATEIITENQL